MELGFLVLQNHKMIIKRNMKAEMQSLKRCKLEEDKDCVNSPIQKKQKVNVIQSVSDSQNLSTSSRCELSEGSNLVSEIHSNSKSTELTVASGKAPPLLRSSRGRVQMLPPRFRDSVVLETWKNNHGRIKRSKLAFEDDNTLEDIGMGFVKKGNENQLIDLEFDYEKHASSFKSIKTTLNGSRSFLVKTESSSFDGNGKKTKKRKDIYKLVDFALGDIVWARCGKSYPAWPAVVIDPILQAPKSVLNCCVPGAVCVMFFGYSKNGKERVNFSRNLICVRNLIYLLWFLVLKSKRNGNGHFAGLCVGKAGDDISLLGIHGQVCLCV